MSGGDMYGEPSYDDVQKDVQAAVDNSNQPGGHHIFGSLLVALITVLVGLGLLVLIVRMLQ